MTEDKQIKTVSLEEIQRLWGEDSKIDHTNLAEESLKIPQIHHKYYKIFHIEKLILQKKIKDLAVLKKIKNEYYTGKLDKQTLDENQWEQFELKVIKTDVPIYMEADKQIQKQELQIAAQQYKVDYLKEIINSLNNRNFLIKNAIEFIKFSQGY